MRRAALLVALGLAVAGCDEKKATPPPPGTPAPARPPGSPPPPTPLSAEDRARALYAFGYTLAQQTPTVSLGLTGEELDRVKKGMTDHVLGRPLEFVTSEMGDTVDLMVRERVAARSAAEKERGRQALLAAAKEKGAVQMTGGAVYIPRVEGKGTGPGGGDVVRVSYTAYLADGTEFDGSEKKGGPQEFRVGSMLRCWEDTLFKMKPGGKARLVCPPGVAFGERGVPGKVPPFATVMFDVELLEVKPPQVGMPSGHLPPAVLPDGSAELPAGHPPVPPLPDGGR